MPGLFDPSTIMGCARLASIICGEEWGCVGCMKAAGGLSLWDEGNAEKGDTAGAASLRVWLAPVFCRFSGGRPRVLPDPLGPPLLHAEETTFAPWRLFVFGFAAAFADLGSPGWSGQKAFVLAGATAE